jgi:hypothetical protein
VYVEIGSRALGSAKGGTGKKTKNGVDERKTRDWRAGKWVSGIGDGIMAASRSGGEGFKAASNVRSRLTQRERGSAAGG